MRLVVPFARFALASLIASTLLATARSEGARILEAPGLPPFTSLQAAVDAAADGDTILLADGEYDGAVIDGKGLALVAAPDQVPHLRGTLEILDLPASRTVVLSGLKITGLMLQDISGPALVVTNCAGNVRAVACTLTGGPGDEPSGKGLTFGRGGHAVVLQASTKVSFSRCTIRGGDGGSDPQFCYSCTGGEGGLGVRLSQSTPAFHECTIRGGDGGQNGIGGGNGGHGLRLLNAWFFAAGSSFTGGKGGNAWDFVWAEGGNGGSGLFVDPGATAELLDNTYAGGAGGVAFVFPQNNGTPGSPKTGGGSFVEHAGTARSLAASRVVVDDLQSVLVNIVGTPGDQVWVRIGTQPAFLPQLSLPGVALVKPGPVTKVPLGVIGVGGNLGAALPTPDLLLEPGRVLYLQAFGRDAFGQPWLAGSEQTLIVDRLSPPDCNANTVSDLVDSFVGTSPDCGPNLRPDECDPDCNGNGTPDDCDLAGGAAVDCNGNGIPDTCDIAGGQSPDCNANGVPDGCDLASGASSDVNGNGVPDECDPNMTWWVDASAPAGGDGSPGLPFQTISQGVQASIDGDEVVVRDGVYTGPGNRNVGFDGRVLVVRSENGAALCTIDLQGAGRAFMVAGGGPGTRIEGFTIVNGAAVDGGAISVSLAGVVVRGCRFVGNSASSYGGAIQLGAAAGSAIEDCVFVGNTTPLGGGGGIFHMGGAIHVSGNQGSLGTVRILRCTFRDNASENGGAIHASGERPIFVSHCTFLDNVAVRWGGAIQNRALGSKGGILSVDDCLFAGNQAGEDGGAIQSLTWVLNYHSDLRVSGCTFSGNAAGARGGAVALESNGKARVHNSVLWGNAAPAGAELATDTLGNTTYGVPELAVERCDVAGGQAGVPSIGAAIITWGPGNLDLDPQFTDPDGLDNDPATTFDNDYRPIAGSPVDDAGANALVPPDVNDVDGDGNTLEPTPLDLLLQPRFVEDPLAPNTGAGTPPLVDMGCYERP
jgi:predicted outer membrane repeat protein